MEQKEHPGLIDNTEISSSSSDSPATPDSPSNVPEKLESAAISSPASEEKKPALKQRLAVAFREGVAAANPDSEKRPEVKITPPAKESLKESGDGGILGRVVQEGAAAAVVVGDKAASVLDTLVQLVRKAPALTQQYAEAFRQGAESVKSQAGRERREEAPTAEKKKGASSDGRAILEKLIQSGESAAGYVREAVAGVNPGEVIGARQRIRLCRKKIDSLYVEIGREAVSSWSGGLVETETLAARLDELQKHEEEIISHEAHLAEAATARKTGAAPQAVKTRAASAPAAQKEESSVDADAPGARPDEAAGSPGDLPRTEDLQGAAPADAPPDEPVRYPEELPPGDREEAAPDVTEAPVPEEPDAKTPETDSVPAGTVDAKVRRKRK